MGIKELEGIANPRRLQKIRYPKPSSGLFVLLNIKELKSYYFLNGITIISS